MSSINRLSDNSTHGGFLSGFIETSVEMPPDGLNGDCIVHYGEEFSEYELMVPLVNGKREGKAIILHEGVPTGKCEYRNGVLMGDVEELDEWECLLLIVSKRIDGSIVVDSADSFISYIIETRFAYGVVRSDQKYYVIDWGRDTNRVVMADLDNKEMIVYMNGERVDLSRTKEVIDLDTNGRRWEGGVKDGKPYGYGALYDEEGRKEYEGFMMNEMKTGYGIEYYSDIEIVKYEGCYYYDDRFGKGTLYDRNGGIEYKGLWKNDKHYSPLFDGKTIDNHIKSIDIPNDSLNDVESLVLPSFIQSVRKMVIGDECFGKVRLFELNGLIELVSVVVGERSFRISDKNRSNGVCRIVNCPKLKFIIIGYRSFSDYHSLDLTNLPSLQSIEIGVRCFFWSPSFSLTSLIDWLVLNSQIFLNYNLSNLVSMHSVVFIRLCLRVIE